jgi:hypothetical protein
MIKLCRAQFCEQNCCLYLLFETEEKIKIKNCTVFSTKQILIF